MKKTIVLILIAAIFFGRFDYAFTAAKTEKSSYDYFLSGSKKYTELDNEGAIEDLEKAVTLIQTCSRRWGFS